MSSTARANECHFLWPLPHGIPTKNIQITVSYLSLDMERMTGAHVYPHFKVDSTESVHR